MQTTSVQVYQDSFEELLNKVDVQDDHAVSLFIGSLKDEIAYDVRMFKPTSLTDAFCLAKLQEASNSVKEIEEKRAKQLCFYCDQKYSPGYKCSGQMYSLEVVGCEEEVVSEECEASERGIVEEEEIMPQISLNAMT
nr:putative mitochondrial protein [Tanacetum cinerariifolium]